MLQAHTAQVKAMLAGSDDEPGAAAAPLLAKRKKDIAAVEALARRHRGAPVRTNRAAAPARPADRADRRR